MQILIQCYRQIITINHSSYYSHPYITKLFTFIFFETSANKNELRKSHSQFYVMKRVDKRGREEVYTFGKRIEANPNLNLEYWCQPIDRFLTTVTSWWLRRFISLASFVTLESTSIECRLAFKSFFLRTTSGLYGSETRLSRLAWLCPCELENELCLCSGGGWSWFIFGRYVWKDGRFCAASMIEPVKKKLFTCCLNTTEYINMCYPV